MGSIPGVLILLLAVGAFHWALPKKRERRVRPTQPNGAPEHWVERPGVRVIVRRPGARASAVGGLEDPEAPQEVRTAREHPADIDCRSRARRWPWELATQFPDEDEHDGEAPRPRVVWVSPERLAEIPWDQRVASPKDVALWKCGHLAEASFEPQPELAANLVKHMRVWRSASGRAAEEGWAVYRAVHSLLGRLTAEETEDALQAVLEAVTTLPPDERDHESGPQG